MLPSAKYTSWNAQACYRCSQAAGAAHVGVRWCFTAAWALCRAGRAAAGLQLRHCWVHRVQFIWGPCEVSLLHQPEGICKEMSCAKQQPHCAQDLRCYRRSGLICSHKRVCAGSSAGPQPIQTSPVNGLGRCPSLWTSLFGAHLVLRLAELRG